MSIQDGASVDGLPSVPAIIISALAVFETCRADWILVYARLTLLDLRLYAKDFYCDGHNTLPLFLSRLHGHLRCIPFL